MENSRCQSLGLVFNTEAYDVLGSPGVRVGVDAKPLLGFGVATRVPSGVWATTLDPSGESWVSINHIV